MGDIVTLQDGTQAADFEFSFTLDSKAIVTEPYDNGHIYIEGLASDFGLDRQDEAFEQGAFEQGLKSYMATNPILLYHHKPDVALGQVVAANVTAEGLHVKARVDSPEPGTIIADYVRKIKNGTLRAFSVGGKFYRRMTEKGPRIFKCDFRELSVTPLAVNPRTLFSIAGKAFESDEPVSSPDMDIDPEIFEYALRIARAEVAIETGEAAAAAQKAWAENAPTVKVTTEDILAFERQLEEGKAAAGATPKKSVKNDGTTQAPSQVPGQLHPDRGKVALLLMHQQKIHQLAEDTRQNAADPEVAKVASDAQKSAKKHSAALHHIAARIGPLPDYYGALA